MLEFLFGLYLLVFIVLALITYSDYFVKSEAPEKLKIWLTLCAAWPTTLWSVTARQKWFIILGIK